MVAVRRGVLPCLAALLASFCLLSLTLLPSSSAQSYVPQFPTFTADSCGPDEQFITVGYQPSDATNRTLFPYYQPDETLGGYWYPGIPIYVYVTPFPRFYYGASIRQLSMVLNDNSGLLGPVSIRMGIYLFQTPEKGTVVDFDFASLLGQTDAITLYPSGPQVLYANLLKPVTLLAEGLYGIAIYANGPIFISSGAYNDYRSPGPTGYSGLYDLTYEFGGGYNEYQLPPALEMYPGDQIRPVGGVGCLSKNAFSAPNTTTYAFCAMIETYSREPRGNGNTQLVSITNTTRYSGVIEVSNTPADGTNGEGFPITFMEGEVQQTYNAGSPDYTPALGPTNRVEQCYSTANPPVDVSAFPFYFRRNHSLFPNASDLLYPTRDIPLDTNGIVLTTARNTTRLYRADNPVANRTIGSTGQFGKVSQVYYSSFYALPAAYLNQVITACTIPNGTFYVPDVQSCPDGSAYVAYGDTNLMDTDSLEEDEEYQYMPPNLLSFRPFKVFAPDASAYQLTYYTWANQEAIVHMRLGLFTTNRSYVDSFNSEPQYELIAMAHEVELVNIDPGLVTANLPAPVPLNVGQLYAIGVWVDAMIYGPASQWGIDAAGLPLPYTSIALDGTMPQVANALGAQTGVQLMGVNMCASNNQLTYVNWCATFGEWRLTPGGWFLIRRYYNGVFSVLQRTMQNDFGTYQIATAGNGTYAEKWWGPASPPSRSDNLPLQLVYNGTWNMNNFQVLSPNYFYSNSSSGLALDTNGMQIIINLFQLSEDGDTFTYNSVYATIINAVKPRGSPEWFYQESVEYPYNANQDGYSAVANSIVTWQITDVAAATPSCDVPYVPWNIIGPAGSAGFLVACTGFAQIQSTYGDNRVVDYYGAESQIVKADTLYTANFTAAKGTLLTQVSLDVLNNLNLTDWVTANFGVYAPNGSLIATTGNVQFLELLDQMAVFYLTQSVTLDVSGLYTVGFVIDTDYAIGKTTGTGPTMSAPCDTRNCILPGTLAWDGFAPLLPLVVYGCVTATHSLCGSFQYYQGRDYSPISYDFLYQGLVRVQDVSDATNAYGTYKPVEYAVGHLTQYARVAKYANQFTVGFTDMLLSKPGYANGDQTVNVVYSQSANGQPLDNYGLTFLSNDDYGAPFSVFYNTTRGRWQDSTNEQLGAELLTTVSLKPINFSVGVPQCSWLDLPSVIAPNQTADLNCPTANTSSVVWGDDISGDYFYSAEGQWANDLNLIVLSPFNTGAGDYSTVTQLGLAINQNGNVFAHIKMALYGPDNMLLGTTEEKTIDNSVDAILIFNLLEPVLLAPASVYYAAYWSDVAFYTSATEDFQTAKCYYNLTYGYDRQPWPSTVGSVEAEYYVCNALPVAAIGCTTPNVVPPPIPPVCPVCPANGTCPINNGTSGGNTTNTDTDVMNGYSIVTLFFVALLMLALGIILTLLSVKLYNAGSCARFGLGSANSADSVSLASRGDSAATSSNRYASLSDE